MTRKMKDSGVEWIGEIPEDWQVGRIKFATQKIGSGKTPKGGSEVYSEAGILFIRSQNVYNAELKLDEGCYISNEIDTEMKSTRVFYKDVLLNITGGSIGRCCLYLIKDKHANVNQHVCIIRPDSEVLLPSYICYFWQSHAGEHSINIYQSGANREGMNFEQIGNSYIPYAAVAEQEKIVAYLDNKCSRIDEVIAREKQLVEKLKDYKQSMITEAVTKGLNPDVKLKASGVEWIGDIPNRWNVYPLNYSYKERKQKNSDFIENNVLSLSYGKIIRRDIADNMGLLPASFSTYNIVEKGNIVLRLTDLQNDKKSLRTGLVKEKGIITSAYLTLEPIIDSNSRYTQYLLHAYDLMKVLYNMGNGVRQNLKYSELRKMPILSPPIKEQQQIADYLDKKCAAIDGTIALKEKLIEKLAAYKKSLIYECVTGKRTV